MSIGMCAGSEWVKQDLDIALFCMEDIWLKLQYQIKWNNNNTAPFVFSTAMPSLKETASRIQI